MGLKGPLRVLEMALADERRRPPPPTAYLAGRALDLGLAKRDKTRGHLFQSIGAAQNFLDDHAAIKARVASAPADHTPWQLSGSDLAEWRRWFATKSGPYGQASFGYDYTTLRNILTRKYGGKTTSGGGANNEFELALRLVARYF